MTWPNPCRLMSSAGEALTRLQRVAGQELLRGQAATTFELQFQNSQRVFATRDENADLACFKNLSRGFPGVLLNGGMPDFEQWWLRSGSSFGGRKVSECAWPPSES